VHACACVRACVRICVGGSIFVHSGAGWYFGNVHACACLKHFFGADVYFSFFFTIKCLKSIQILKKKKNVSVRMRVRMRAPHTTKMCAMFVWSAAENRSH
jgi:hypothetical protein